MDSTPELLYFAIPINIIINSKIIFNPTFFLLSKLNHEFYCIFYLFFDHYYFKVLIKLNFPQINFLLL
jgi:hypothetical protein